MDFKTLIGKLALDTGFAALFFSNREKILADFALSHQERLMLDSIDEEKLGNFLSKRENMAGDCDSCCNGGQGGGNCSECFSNCCA